MYQTADGDSPLVMLPLGGGPARQLVSASEIRALSPDFAAAGIYYGPCESGPQRSIHLIDPRTGHTGCSRA